MSCKLPNTGQQRVKVALDWKSGWKMKPGNHSNAETLLKIHQVLGISEGGVHNWWLVGSQLGKQGIMRVTFGGPWGDLIDFAKGKIDFSKNSDCGGMVDWTLEWSKCHPIECWGELMVLQSSAKFKAYLLHSEEVSELEWHSTRDTESSQRLTSSLVTGHAQLSCHLNNERRSHQQGGWGYVMN